MTKREILCILIGIVVLAVSVAAAPTPPLSVTPLQTGATSVVNGNSLDVQGYGTAAFVVSGSFTATITFQASGDNGANWSSLLATNVSSGVSSTTTTSAGIYIASVAGLTTVRAAITDYTNGSVTVTGTHGAGGGGAGGGGGGGGGAVSDGSNVVEGSTTDTATFDANGTINGHVRGLAKAVFDAWDSTNHLFSVGLATTLDKSQDSISIALNGTTVDGNSGNKSAGTIRMVLATDQPAMTNAQPSNQTQIGGTTIDTNSGNKSAGTQRMVLATDQPNLTTPLNVIPQATTAGGATPYFYAAAGAANQDATAIKASAGQLYNITLTNNTASQRYVWFYNVASGATSASTVVYGVALPANTTGSGATISIPVGMAFSTGISFRITTGAPGSSTGAASANDVFVSCAYQ